MDTAFSDSRLSATTQSEVNLPHDDRVDLARHIQSTLRGLRSRQWQLWSSTALVTILLTLAMASFVFPGLLAQSDASYSFDLNQAIRGLVGLVLLFNVYMIYQQLQVHRMQAALTTHASAVDMMKRRADEVYTLAAVDSLTGLYSRRFGEQRLAKEISRAHRSGLPLAIVVSDVDGLKSVNDRYGHAAGDRLLRYFAERLKRAIRGADVAIRVGGDEFLLILPECNSEDLRLVLGRVADLTFRFEQHSLPLTFAAGCANYVSGESMQDLLSRADGELYINKSKRMAREHNATLCVAE